MKLFIGNATRQKHQFHYTLPGGTKTVIQSIEPGTQEQIAGDFNPEDIDHIVKLHAPYGLIQDSAIDQAKGFRGVCYSIGKPITGRRLTYLVNRNIDELVMRGRDTRTAAAVAQNSAFQRNLIENDRPEQITGFEVTVQEDRMSDDPNPAPQIAEGLRVVRDGQTPKSPSSRQRRAA